MMGHLNSFSASGGGNLNKNFEKFKCPGGCPGGMLKLRFDWYIISQAAQTLFVIYIRDSIALRLNHLRECMKMVRNSL